jgi:hypothetical protein
MLTALFTSSDRQLDTKERRRYELKLSKAPNMRTVIIALLAIFVIASGLTALGAEIKVTDVASLQACVSGNAIPAGSSSPDVGRTAGPGDTCVVFDGVYNVPAQLVVSVENLIVRSMNGATATIIQGNVNGALINIIVRGVTFGGPAADQGFTVTNTDGWRRHCHLCHAGWCCSSLQRACGRFRYYTCRRRHRSGEYHYPEQPLPQQRGRGRGLLL